MSTQGTLPPCPSVSSLRFETETLDTSYLAGESAAMHRVRSQLERIAPHVRTALITGETGTGKEQVARMLHARGPGADGPFIIWEAEPLTKMLIETDKGSAILLEAHGGTLFLAKMGTVPLTQQPALLRMLQLQEQRTHRCDVRIVTSSDRDLRTLTMTGQFREDLYRRIGTVEIGLAPLRRRQEDIAEVAETLLRRAGGRGISAEAVVRLEQHTWPRNVRELREVLDRALELAGNAVVDARHLRLPERHEDAEPNLEPLQDVVRRHVLEVLTRCSGNKLRASEVLGISRSTLYRMLDACAAGSAPGCPR